MSSKLNIDWIEISTVQVWTKGYTAISVTGGYNRACSRFYKVFKVNPKRLVNNGTLKHTGQFTAHPNYEKAGMHVRYLEDGKVRIAEYE